MQAGKAFYATLSLQHEPGYHTYWSQPGIAGVPMTLEWMLPAGWQATPTIWANPEYVKMGQLGTHGYEKDTVLAWELTPPASQPDGTVFLPAKLRWMCCAQRCYPGFEQLVLPICFAGSGGSAEANGNAKAVAALLASQPQPMKQWAFQAKKAENHVALTGKLNADAPLPPPSDGASVRFFSENTLICSHEPQTWQWAADGRSFTAMLPIASYALAEDTQLQGVIHRQTGWGMAGTSFGKVSVTLTP